MARIICIIHDKICKWSWESGHSYVVFSIRTKRDNRIETAVERADTCTCTKR